MKIQEKNIEEETQYTFNAFIASKKKNLCK